MDKKKLAKQAAIIAACTGIAIAAPQFAPFLAFASKDLIGDVFSQFFTENDKTADSIGKIGINAVGGILTNLASSAIWDVPNSLGGGKQNEDLARALAQAYHNSLDVVESKIADDVVKEQAAKVFPLLRARLDRALAAKNREDELLALFPLRKTEKNQQPQDAAQSFGNALSAEDFILKLSADDASATGLLADEIEIAARRWYNEEIRLGDNDSSSLLKLTADTALPEPLRGFLRKAMAAEIPSQISRIVKDKEFENSWISFQRSHLQAIYSELQKNKTLSVEEKALIAPLAERLNNLSKLENVPETLAAMSADILSRSHESEANLKQFIAVQAGNFAAKFAVQLSEMEARLTGVLTQRFDQLEEKIERAYKYRDKQSVQQARESNLKPIPNALPGAHDVFDRTNECAKLFDLLIAEDTRLVRILAPSGYGKTKLVAKFLQQTARQINQETGQSPVDGILYVECQAGASIVWGQIVERTGLMFGRREELRDEISRIQSPPQQAAYLLDELEAAGRFWLVFDNFESLLDAENAMVGADESDPIRNLFHLVCSEADNQRLVVTTRREPVFKGKNAPLLQNRFLLEVGGTPETDAINYLRTEGKDYLLDQLDQIDKTVLRDFVRRVDCLPLAVISLLRDLKSYFDSKPTGKVTLDDVAAIVAAGTRYVEADKENGLRLWLTDQIKQLHPDEKDLLCALSAFNKPCPAIALEFVLPDFSAGKIEKLLARLERDRLLYQEGDGFQLSVIIRDAAYSLIPAEVSAMEDNQSAKGQRDFNRNTLHSRSADFYRTQRKPQEQWKTIADLQPQLDEIYQRIQAGEFETAAEVLQGIDFKYLLLWSNYRLIIELREQLEVRLPENGFLALAQANILGLAYRNTGRIRESIKQFEKAIQIAKLINNQQGEGASLGNLGNAYYNLGDYRKAIEYHEQHLNISREIGNRLGEGQSLGNLGSAYYSLGYYRKAIEYHEQSLQIKREIGDRFGEGNSLGNLGNAYYSLGYYRKAIEYHEQALEIDREIGNRLGEGQSLGNLGNAYHSLGETEKACGLWREALIIFEAIESPYANNARQWLEKNCRS